MAVGCWDRKEINDLAIVTGAGIHVSDDNEIEVSAQILAPSQVKSGGNSQNTQGASTLLWKATGKDIADAVENLQEKISRKTFWGQCEVFIISEKLAEKGVQKQIDYLYRFPQIRERSFLYIFSGDPANILKISPSLERNSSEVLRELSVLKTQVNVTLKEFESMLAGEAGAAMLPIITLPAYSREDKRERSPYVQGTAIFKRDKMTGRIDHRSTNVILWLKNQAELENFTIKTTDETGYLSLRLLHVHTEYLPKIVKGIWKMAIHMTVESNIIHNGTKVNTMNPDFTKKIEEMTEKEMKKQIKQSIDIIQKSLHADILGFADAFHRKYPKKWAEVKHGWDELYPKIEVEIHVNTKIRRPGMNRAPAGLPEGRVKKE